MVRKFNSAAERTLADAKKGLDTGYSHKRKKKLYQFRDEIHMTNFFWWKKSLISEGYWAELDKKEKAVLPVILSHASEPNNDNICEAFPSQLTIAVLAGYSLYPVQQAIPRLTSIPGFKFKIEKQRGHDRYLFDLPKNSKKSPAFMFHKNIIESGVWRELSPSAKALYPVMRAFAHFNNDNDLEEYADQEGIEIDDYCPAIAYTEIFRNREYDFCTETISKLCRFSGITAPSYKKAIEDLRKWGLIERIGNRANYWKVYFLSKYKPKPEYLNEKTFESFQHIIIDKG